MKTGSATTQVNVLAIVLIVAAIVVGILAVVRFDTTGKRGSGLSSQYDYDIEEVAKIDPNLILYREVGAPVRTSFKAARAIAVGPSGRVYVAGDEAIRVFDEGPNSRLSFFGEIKLDGEPQCLTVADDGKLYVGMKDHVEVLDDRGNRLARWGGLGDEAVLTSIAVYQNDIFVADAGNRIVLRYNKGGNLVNKIGKRDPDRNIPGFVIPSPYFDVAVARDGLLRVTNPGQHHIEAYTFNGDLEFWWGEFSTGVEGFCGCCNPVNFAILDDGSFVTCEKGLIRVKLYGPDGAFVGVVAGPEQLVEKGAARVCTTPAECQAGGFDVAVDAQGRVLVLDTIRNVVRVFARKRQ